MCWGDVTMVTEALSLSPPGLPLSASFIILCFSLWVFFNSSFADFILYFCLLVLYLPSLLNALSALGSKHFPPSSTITSAGKLHADHSTQRTFPIQIGHQTETASTRLFLVGSDA